MAIFCTIFSALLCCAHDLVKLQQVIAKFCQLLANSTKVTQVIQLNFSLKVGETEVESQRIFADEKATKQHVAEIASFS